MYTAYAVYATWTHSKTGKTVRDRIAYNLDREGAEAYRDTPGYEIIAYDTAAFIAVK